MKLHKTLCQLFNETLWQLLNETLKVSLKTNHLIKLCRTHLMVASQQAAVDPVGHQECALASQSKFLAKTLTTV